MTTVKELNQWYVDGLGLIAKLEQSDSNQPDWHWPTTTRIVTQDYGANPDYYSKFKLTEKGYFHPKYPNPGHEGLDIATRKSTNIYAMRDGVAVNVFFPSDPQSYAYGNHIRIEHSLDGVKYRTVYAHLKNLSNAITQGQSVKAGTIIAQAGNTGNSRGRHLHLTVYRWFDGLKSMKRIERFRIINPGWLFMGITGV